MAPHQTQNHPHDGAVAPETSYAIYTIERLPKGSKRTPKWDLHSTAQDKTTAESYAKTLAAQPYFNYVEVREFKTCPDTNQRSVKKIKSYSRQSSMTGWVVTAIIVTAIAMIAFL